MGKRGRKKKKRKPYNKRSDLEKCQAQWWKLTGLHDREEWAAAIVRAATAAEIACNYAVRTEFTRQGNLRLDVVDKFLKDANGLRGKMDRLLLPLVKGTNRERAIAGLKKFVDGINSHRNNIVHSGEFSNEAEATQMIEQTRKFIEGIVHFYEPNFTLRDQDKRPTEL
jgi:hypothetical protein